MVIKVVTVAMAGNKGDMVTTTSLDTIKVGMDNQDMETKVGEAGDLAAVQ